MRKMLRKWSLTLKIIPILLFVGIMKFIFHSNGWEILTLNPLFSSIVGGTTFLLGFLISGVMADYKESEKIPSEIAASFDVLFDEASSKNIKEGNELKAYLIETMDTLKRWLYQKEKTFSVLKKIGGMNEHFSKLEKDFGSSVSRMKTEQNIIRKSIIRINTIRDTSFVVSAYAIAEALTFFLLIALIVVKMTPFYEAAFFVSLVSFLVCYMLLLIKDLDNPFDYKGHGENGTEISLKPIYEVHERMKEGLKK